MYSCLFFPNCTRNLVITYTNKIVTLNTCGGGDNDNDNDDDDSDEGGDAGGSGN